MSNIRDLFSRDRKEKVPPDLRRALDLLRLDGFEELEDRFLSTDAFLRPWSMFRDCMFLLFPDAMSRAIQVVPFGIEAVKGVSRLDILWFYTQFDEGTLRYDPRADKHCADYTPNAAVYGMIDKSKWSIEEYEKHLFAWLLQEFKVGKGYNPWRFKCFELTNICTVWEQVLVPIVDAVRTSYNPGGRRHYGRLALFIEARCPSQLAFPDSNVAVPPGSFLSPTPYRIISMPRATAQNEGISGVLTGKQYDTTERELRDVYPQYGGLVERPRFKHKMEEWLAEQRARADRRRGLEKCGEVWTSQPQIVQRTPSHSPFKQPQSTRGNLGQWTGNARAGSESPMKRYADGLKRSISNTMSSMRIKDEKSSLHGVTRQLQFPDRTLGVKQESWSELFESQRDSFVITPLPRPQNHHRDSETSVYGKIRTSNPITEMNTRTRADTDDSVLSPMGQLSAIPRPLQEDPDVARDLEPASDGKPNLHAKKSYYNVRMPSYEGNEYEREISLTELHTHRKDLANGSESAPKKRTPATRLPAPIVPIPYVGPRVASADTPTRSSAPSITQPPPVLAPPKQVATPKKPVVAPAKSVGWPGPSSTKPKATAWPNSPSPVRTAWPGAESESDYGEFTPPIPSKSPERNIRNPRFRQHQRRDSEQEVFRIVSRENIRMALGDVSPESSTEHLVQPKSFVEPVHTMDPNKQPLQTYNTHLFPKGDERKGSQGGGDVDGD
ncbi:hypothetical protein BDU57DRAFT_405855, partial [Ampelomyces quisqualis]